MLLKKIIAFFLFFLSSLFFLIFFLINGIKIDSFSLGGFSVSQFYIKFDKKLIVDIDKITFKGKKSSKNSSIEEIKSILNKAPTILSMFERIDIEEIKIKDNSFKIKFDNEYIYLDNKFINLASKYSEEGNILNLDIYSIYLKDLDFLLLGNVKIDFDDNVLNFSGNYRYKNRIDGELSIQSNKKELDFFVNSGEMENIKFLKNYIKLDSIAESWMYENVKGKYYLDNLYGKVDLKTFRPILNSIKGYARVVDAKVKFNKKLDAVNTPLINIEYKNDNLLINLKKPKYKGISIDESFVDIKDVTSLKYGHVDVTLKAKHKLDDKVLNILKAYNINLPLKQYSGVTDAYVHLYIPYNSPMKTFGVFKAKDATFKINDFEFFSKSGTVDLINHNVIIKDTDFIHDKLIDAKVNLNINIKTLKSKGEAYLNSFLIKSDNQEIVSVKDKKVDISLDFNKQTKLTINDFKTDILFKPKYTNIKVSNFEKIYPYSKLLQDIKVKKGDVNIKLYDLNNIDFTTNIYDFKSPLRKNKKELYRLKLLGKIDENKTSLSTNSNDLKIELINNDINIIVNGYDIDLKKENKSSSFSKDINVRLLDSNIELKDDTYYSIDSNINIRKDKIAFDGAFGKLDLPLEINSKKIDKLDIKGSLEKGVTKVQSKDKKIELISTDDNTHIKLDGMNLLYNSKEESSFDKEMTLNAKNSNIIINNKHKVLANTYQIFTKNHETSFFLKYKNAKIIYKKSKNQKIKLTVKDIDDVFVNTFFNKEMVKEGTFTLDAIGKNDYISGKMLFNKNRLMNLAILNNIIAVVNTTPALINPLLAVPAVFGMVTKDGFNLNGYSVNDGYVDFTYNFKDAFLNLTKIHTIGNSVDFDGYATIDLNKSIVNSKIDLVFMKDYSKIVNYIPGLNYIFLGDDKRISTTVDIKGDLENPTIETNIAKESASAPFNILKRIITSPFKLFEKSE